MNVLGINKKKFFLKMITTFFGVGTSRVAPGTCGSLAAVLVWWLLLYTKPSLLNQYLISFFCVLILVLTAVGWGASYLYMKEINNNDDPQEIVIDEVVGQLISYFLTSVLVAVIGHALKIDVTKHIKFLGFVLTILPFLLFRFYDIKKPLLVGYFDKNFKNAFGVMADDVVGGIFAGLTGGFITFCWLLPWHSV
jgi:phosphatidylglycerophosphatase A